jgi:hypothetical protein
MPATSVQRIDSKIQYGRGREAGKLGQTYTVQRMTPTTNVSVTSTPPVIQNFPARIQRARKMAIENQSFDLLVVEATCDNRKLQLMDVLNETGYKSDGGVYTVAQFRPTRETLWVRTESNIAITRPLPGAGQAVQMPTTPGVTIAPDGTWGGVTKAGEQVLTLVDGVYSFSNANAAPAGVQAGLQPLNRVREVPSSTAMGKTPMPQYREEYLVWLPMLDGVYLDEHDRLNFLTRDRYEIAQVFTTDLTGLSGYIVTVKKLGV